MEGLREVSHQIFASRVKDEEGASRITSLFSCSFVICQELSQQFYKDIFKTGHSIVQAYYSTENKVPRAREKPFPKACAEARAERAAEQQVRGSCRV